MHVRSRDPLKVVEALRRNGISHALIDGGPTLNSAFLKAALVREVHAYVAPILLGSGTRAITDLGISTLTDALNFRVTDVTRLGSDTVFVLTPEVPS